MAKAARKDVPINFYVEARQKRSFDRFARKAGLSRSEALRQAMSLWLQKQLEAK